ncbi:uncharacterized protein CDAR_64341 [Caerostris darwini]|uniref:Gustatory receptor n=1 Tax=Caerostris darwini TaxID=1538125 RepID=A0AAV4RRD5_9ARAC|nr:uncharacterized protein CDAR_64341 [Caerostris darwini]
MAFLTKNHKIVPVGSCFRNKGIHSRDNGSTWTPVLHGLRIIGVFMPTESNGVESRQTTFKKVGKILLRTLWDLILFISRIINVYESMKTLWTNLFMLSVDTVILIFLKFTTQSKLRKVVSQLKRIDGFLKTDYQLGMWKMALKRWVYIGWLVAFIFCVANFAKLTVTLNIDNPFEDSVLHALSFHIRWPLLKNAVDVIFRIALAGRSALSIYLPTLIFSLCCLTYKIEWKIIQHQNEEIAKCARKDLSCEVAASAAILINNTTALIYSVNNSLSTLIFLLMCFWISNIFFCFTNLLQATLMPQDLENQIHISCIIGMFFAMFAYLAYSASTVKEAYGDLENHLLAPVQFDPRRFEETPNIVNFDLLRSIHKGLEVKISITPLDLLTVEARLIFTILGAIITYSVMISQFLGN